MIPAYLSGFALSLSLILAIGAQNAFVLRQGLRGEHVLVVCALCAASDAVLICLGVFGAGWVAAQMPGLAPVMRYGGAAFLLGYGALNIRAAWRGGRHLEPAERRHLGMLAACGTCLLLTWANPHVYLDTLVLLGSLAQPYHDHRPAFALGAACASVVFFFALGYGARWLRPFFARPQAWRLLDGGIGVMMIGIGLGLIA